MRTAAILLVLGSHSLADKKPKEPPMNDHQLIQGTWSLISGERHGKAFQDDVVKNVLLEFSKDSLSTKTKDQTSKATFKLHSESSPKGIDLNMDGSVGQGIYKLNGDSLTILHGEVGDKRPTSFDPKETPGVTLLVLKRRSSRQLD